MTVALASKDGTKGSDALAKLLPQGAVTKIVRTDPPYLSTDSMTLSSDLSLLLLHITANGVGTAEVLKTCGDVYSAVWSREKAVIFTRFTTNADKEKAEKAEKAKKPQPDEAKKEPEQAEPHPCAAYQRAFESATTGSGAKQRRRFMGRVFIGDSLDDPALITALKDYLARINGMTAPTSRTRDG